MRRKRSRSRRKRRKRTRRNRQKRRKRNRRARRRSSRRRRRGCRKRRKGSISSHSYRGRQWDLLWEQFRHDGRRADRSR